jgi:plastocyanin
MKKLNLLAGTAVIVALATAGAFAADVTGTVKLDGQAPGGKKIKMDADPFCAEAHADTPAKTEEVLVDEQGMLRNVFVYVKTGLEGKTFEPPKTPVEIDQHGCMYTPRVFGMQAKQPLKIKNDDDTLHNVHALPTKSKEFNIGQPNKGMETTRTFAEPEVMVKFKCDVHPWMAAYVGVLPHPFFSTTGADGAFAIKGLPAGTYEIEAWHEKYGTQTQKITVADGEAKALAFTFKAE